MTRKAYSTDLSDRQWEIIAPLLPAAKSDGGRGRKRTVNLREIVNAILYWSRSGCAWELLPHDFPPSKTVYGYWRKWQRQGVLQEIQETLRGRVRQQEGRNPEPTGGLMDSQQSDWIWRGNLAIPRSQSVKTTDVGGEERGFDGGKKVNGRKRHLLVDTLGLVLVVIVHAANIADVTAGRMLLAESSLRVPTLKQVWVDRGYRGEQLQRVAQGCDVALSIVEPSSPTPGFEVQPRRWVVERTWAWLGRQRRLSKDYERLPEVSESVVHIAMIALMLNRLTA